MPSLKNPLAKIDKMYLYCIDIFAFKYEFVTELVTNATATRNQETNHQKKRMTSIE